ncbi:hypothetical protein [Nevskia sp.]|uniref:hypothetical protein n=1 Tax=Nevskia sp. TaxID=1929292 RepID=UPI0025D76394|nr:hypothetical protein [Nevskia sp.]
MKSAAKKSVLLAAMMIVCAMLAAITTAVRAEAPGLIPPVPDAPAAAASQSAQQSAYGIGKAKLPPPPKRSACLSKAEYDAALHGSGCDCSCGGYAKGPASQCQTACALSYYSCWAPDPTPAESGGQFDDPSMRQVIEALAPADRAELLRGQMASVMLDRANAWFTRQQCAESR